MALNCGWTYRERVSRIVAGCTLLDFLANTHGHSTRDEWEARVAGGQVEVEGRTAGPGDVLRSGQQVVWHRPPWDEAEVPLRYEVLFEDEVLLAVNKPAGLPTMPAGGFLEHTLLSRVIARVPDARPLHRLGRFTSGVVLFAKTPAAAAGLSRAWGGPDVIKRYRALGTGTPEWTSLEIDAAIGPVPHSLLGSVHAASPDGRAAHSVATVRGRCRANTIFDVRITTGRPHQIRIHLAWAGHPLVGDPLYVRGGVPGTAALPGDGGYFLHAESLGVRHPASGQRMEFSAALPESWPADD